jgi:MFS family permease
MAVALNRSYPALLALMFVAGGAMVATNTAASSVLQSSIDDGLRGRVASIFSLALRGGAPIGNLATGLVVSRWGVHIALFVNGALAFLVHAALVRSRPRPASSPDVRA